MKKHKVIQLRHLSDSTFVIRMERNGMPFQTGQFLILSLKGQIDRREYSVYSGENDDFLEVLVREVEGGKVSSKLKRLKPGDQLDVDGPFGFFKFSPDMFSPQKFLFIATGTGISPFHSFVKTHPGLDYQLIHGVRYLEEAYDHKDFDPKRITLCTSADKNGDFEGRVTAFVAEQKLDLETNCFLCGNSEMIYEMFDILTGKGIPVSNIYSEVYF
ncbi:oxidoreductase [Maribellus sp. CM-23]|uniref:ferredoxin--NADP reductase n=1 Tax=Maribellus sp. CM-23 TaxID=2781026 RepID=UPI001F28B986|nr:FAD-binding oxidoreductase [Maribellus sp. CM-23]MCE4564829.1 oxidoreductase [Maribellus sp. CM-23]